MAEDILSSLGLLVLGSRLKRVGTILQSETQAWLRSVGCDVPPGNWPMLAALDRLGPTTLGGLVEALGVAQPGVSRIAKALEAEGWIESATDDDDRRVRLLRLTPKGARLVTEAKQAQWPVIEGAVAEVCAGLAGTLPNQLAELERKLAAGDYQRALAAKAGEDAR